MKYNKKNIILSIIEIIVGISLFICSVFNLLDSFWSGLGTALFMLGIIHIIRSMKYKNNEEYRSNVEIELNDERNNYIVNLAWKYTGNISIIIGCLLSIVFKILKYDAISIIIGCTIAVITFLYFIVSIIIRKKL